MLFRSTHYAELKAYALNTDRVENASCEFDIETLSPTYRLIIGTPGRSNAFAISTHLGMPDEVVDRARDLISDENTEFETTVEKLEQSRAALDKEREKAEEATAAAEQARKEAEASKAEIEKLRDEETEKARKEARRIVEHAEREAAFFMDDLDRLKKERRRAKDLAQVSADAKLTIRRHENKLDDITNPIAELAEDDNYVLPRPLKVGDSVIVADLAEPATVTKLADKNGMVEVTAGILKTRVPESRLRLDEKGKAAKTRKPKPNRRGGSHLDSKLNKSVDTTVDLRGMDSEEAVSTLDRFLDLQYRVGIRQFTVIHGKGTGVLRKAVGRYLKNNKRVESYRLGTYGEGEEGVTIVTLKK